MFLPKSKYTVKQAKPGEYVQSDGTEYVGPIMETYTEEVFAGENPLDTTGKLTSVVETDADLPTKTIHMIKRIPTEEEYTKGSMVRYFCQDLRSLKVVEVLEKEYREGVVSDSKTYNYVSGSWILTGSLEDKTYKIQNFRVEYVVPGVRSKNQKEIGRLEELVPGISSSGVLSNPAQFVRENT